MEVIAVDVIVFFRELPKSCCFTNHFLSDCFSQAQQLDSCVTGNDKTEQ